MYFKQSVQTFNIAAVIIFISLIFTGCHKKSATQSGTIENSGSQEVVLYTVESSPQIPFARANIAFPGQNEILEDDDVFVVIEVDNFRLGAQTNTARATELSNSPKGQHVHFIVDNKAYVAVYEQGQPVNVGKLGPGTHTVVAFPSRSYHESIKSETAYDIKNFNIVSADNKNVITRDAPSIVYSRPKGTYKGEDAREIMLDFYLINVKLGPEGNFARYTITKNTGAGDSDEVYSIDVHEWKPSIIRGLGPGVYTVTLELLDNNGNPVPGAWNRSAREIEVISE